jgi:fatty-acyl-CoA synthase
MNIPLTPVRFLERTLKLRGEKNAVVCGDFRFTYAEYGKRVNQFSNALLRLGVQRGDRISYLGYNCHRLLEAFYGIPAIGAVLMPLNIRLVPSDFEYIINESEPRILFLDWDFIPQIDSIRKRIPSVDQFILLGRESDGPEWISGTYDQLLESSSSEPPYSPGNYPFEEDDTAEIFYTSGTTGRPKGVMLTHRNLYLHALSLLASCPMDETDIQIHLIPLFHVNGWGTPHYLTAMGGTHVMLQKFDPTQTLRLIQKEKVTRFYLIPTMANALLNLPDFGAYDLSSVRRILIGGAPPPTGMIERVEQAFGALTSTAFGMTEACPLIAWPELSPHLDEETRVFRARQTWGFPMVGVEYRIVDPEGNDLPWDGESVGELLVRGDMIMKGYYNSPKETADTLRDGWYHTGDLCAMGPDGSLYVKDRKKDIIISGGENISSLEVEAVLYSHPDILECAVIAKPDEKWGEIPVAFVVPKPGSQLTPEGVMAFSRQHLAHFKAPKEVRFIAEFPRGGTGKILKSVLRNKLKFNRE